MIQIDQEDRKFLLRWLINQGVSTILLFVVVSVGTYLGLTYIPAFVQSAIQVPIQLERLNDNFHHLDETLLTISSQEESNEKKSNQIIELVKDNNTMLKVLSSR